MISSCEFIVLFLSHILHICILFAFDKFYLMIYFYLFIVKKDGGKLNGRLGYLAASLMCSFFLSCVSIGSIVMKVPPKKKSDCTNIYQKLPMENRSGSSSLKGVSSSQPTSLRDSSSVTSGSFDSKLLKRYQFNIILNQFST